LIGIFSEILPVEQLWERRTIILFVSGIFACQYPQFPPTSSVVGSEEEFAVHVGKKPRARAPQGIDIFHQSWFGYDIDSANEYQSEDAEFDSQDFHCLRSSFMPS
jgi:hypothetical protein